MENIEQTIKEFREYTETQRMLLKNVYGFNGNEHIIYMNGGLGNQMFQFFFYQWLSCMIDEPVIVDDTYFFVEKKHNGLEIEKLFGCKMVKLSEALPESVFAEMLNRRAAGEAVAEQLYKAGYPISVIGESNAPTFSGPISWIQGYHPGHMRNKGMIYYHMYNIDGNYLRDLQKIGLFPANPFSKELNGANAEYAKKIKSTESVALHIRRGDFVALGWATEDSVYKSAVKMMNEKLNNPLYFIFSDDLNYCKEHLKEFGLSKNKVVFVEGNVAPNNYLDLQLMAMCKHRIVSNSSFCYLAALLRENEGLILNMNPSRKVI
ncbi:MAG: alpha-1,2-fucosyltransferase [Selenomonadaceae bacterium]|nr:alpha-1,2-fucosyltransferase [Selenomonadaceae bacterium]